jgi:hypothetical protein
MLCYAWRVAEPTALSMHRLAELLWALTTLAPSAPAAEAPARACQHAMRYRLGHMPPQAQPAPEL